MRCAYGDGYRATTDGSAGGRPAQSFSSEQQCAYMASSACGSGGGSFPNKSQYLNQPLRLEMHTSSSDQDLFPPADIFLARRFAASEGWEFISGRGESTWGWWWSMFEVIFVMRNGVG